MGALKIAHQMFCMQTDGHFFPARGSGERPWALRAVHDPRRSLSTSQLASPSFSVLIRDSRSITSVPHTRGKCEEITSRGIRALRHKV